MRLRHRLLGDGNAMRVIAGAADQPVLRLEGAELVRVDPRNQPLHLGHHFGTDAVTGKKQEFLRDMDTLSFWYKMLLRRLD